VAAADLGSDFGGGRDLDPSLRSASELRSLADCIVRRLTTDKGALQDYPNYGFNLENAIGRTLSESAIRQGILGQVFAEEEVEDASLDLTLTDGTLMAVIEGTAGDAPFKLTISVDSLGVEAIIPPNI